MVNIKEFSNPNQKPKDPKAVLAAMERGVFDAVVSISAAMDKGLIVGFLLAPSTNGTMAEIIFPPKEGAAEDEPNPSKQIGAATPAAVISMAGEIMHQMIEMDHQQNAAHSDYISTRKEHRRLRDSAIIIARMTPGTN